MKFRVLFAACATAAAVVSSAAAAAAAPSGAASSGTAAVGPVASAPAPIVINLHPAFASAEGRAVSEGRAGIVPTTRARFTRRAQTAACKEPDCNLAYHRGPVQHAPKIYLLLWGPNWTNSDPGFAFLYFLYKGLGVPGRDSWSGTTVQYGDTTGHHPGFTGAELLGAYKDSATPPGNVTPNDLAAEADAFASHLKIKDRADTQIVVASQSGTCFSDGFAGSCGTPTTASSGYCGWHSISSHGTVFTNLPYQLDAQGDCGENWINGGTAGEYDGFTTVGGHEYAETITDPNTSGTHYGWIDLSDNISGGEIGDKCAWGGQIFGLSDPAGDVKLSTGTFAMQSLWSNAGSHCVMGSVPHLAVTKPANQTTRHGKAVSLQIHASVKPGTTLVYTAAGLPKGLTINRLTGRITGKPAKTGTSRVTVTVADVASSVKVGFTWKVT